MIILSSYPVNKSPHTIVLLIASLFMVGATLHAQPLPVDKVRTDFKTLLQRPTTDPRPFFTSVATDSVLVEKGFFYSEATEKVPVLIYKPVGAAIKKWPVVICLHGTGGSKDNVDIKNLLYRFSKAGFMAVAIDGRHHGERANAGPGHNSYVEAIITAWQNKDSTHQEHPFFFDTVYDLWKLVDYLVTRPDIEPNRIGMMGISKGGIETWMAAATDTRIKVAVPVIAAQSFQWSLENDRWQGRARTIWGAHVQVAKDLGDTGVNKNNVQQFWNKLLPGITGEFDCPSMIRLFAPRPLLLLSTENDQNCPLPGAKLAFEAASQAYRSKNAMDKLKMDIAANEPHRFTAKHMEMAVNWFIKWL
ncbi:MAG TPA: acetylxylan esterase [Chitinophagaceae bacterium]|nr:acetylxylan esterase [Chitinophagaceae bacterium]